jgi:hypothetical protein
MNVAALALSAEIAFSSAVQIDDQKAYSALGAYTAVCALTVRVLLPKAEFTKAGREIPLGAAFIANAVKLEICLLIFLIFGICGDLDFTRGIAADVTDAVSISIQMHEEVNSGT